MIILIITIILAILGIVMVIIGNKSWRYEVFFMIGVILIIVTSTVLLCEIGVIISKPIDYKNFKIQYETITEMQTSKNDIRDAEYTKNLIEINNEIKTNREYINSKWVGIFYNKKIAEMENLNKGE